MIMFLYTTLQTALQKNSFIAIVLITVSGISALPRPVLPPEIHQGIVSAIDYVFKEDFPLAENEGKRLIRKFPDHPAGYFCMAYVIDSWMALYQSDAKENELYRYCDLAIEKGEKLYARNKNDEWARFFIGGADGYKGTYEARYERWITAFRYGWKGVSVLLDLKADGSEIPDIYSGVGCYNYWRSALMKMLWWMPGIEDKRQEGIEQLLQARQQGIYTRLATSVTLIDILVNEGRFAEVLSIADEGLQKYPESTAFLWGRGRGLFGVQRYSEAIPLLEKMIKKVEQMSPDNHYNLTLYHFYLAKCFLEEEKFDRAAASCMIIRKLSYDPAIKKRLDPVLNELKNLYKQATQGAVKNR